MVIEDSQYGDGCQRVWFGLLGPLTVKAGGVELALGGPRERAVLAMLLLERNRVVSVDRLVDALWGEAPPSTCRQQVTTCVSVLRRGLARAGAAGLIETRRPGYRLRVSAEQVDHDRFDAFARAGRDCLAARPADAEPPLREALGCWRGVPLADIDSALIRTLALRLADAEAEAAEDWLEALLLLHQHEEVCREAAVLVGRFPLRERLVRQQVTALYRAGRAADALAAYRRARDLFADELGLEPSPQLQDVQRAILDHDADRLIGAPVPPPAMPPPAVVPPPAPKQLPRAAGGLTGRAPAVRRLLDHLLDGDGDGADAAAPVAALAGPGGAGKTALAVHVAHLVSARFPDGQLYVTFGGGGRRPRWTYPDVLARLLRGLGTPGRAVPDEIDDRVALYRSLTAGRRLLLVLDDAAHEGDVRDLLPATAGCAAIVTSRPRLTGLGDVLHVDVDVLRPAESVELLVQVAGRRLDLAEPAATRALAGICGGLPLALHIAAARLAARPHWSVAGFAARMESERRRLDELTHGDLGVRLSMSLSYEELGAPARQLFRRLGLLEVDDFAGWVAAPLLDTGAEQAADVLEELVTARLIEASGAEGQGPRYRMHDLLRVFSRERLAADDTATDRDGALARLLGCLLHLTEESHRRYYGGDYSVMRGNATRVRLDPASVAALVGEPQRWIKLERALLVSAVAQAARAGLTELCWELAHSCTTQFDVAAYFDDWRTTSQIALDAALAAGDRRGEAVMRCSLGELANFQNRSHQAIEQLSVAARLCAAISERHGQGLAVRAIANALCHLGRLRESETRYLEAQRLLAPIDDPPTKLHIIYQLARIAVERGRHDVAESSILAALATADPRLTYRWTSMLHHRLAEARLARSDLDGAVQAVQTVLGKVQADGDKVGEAYLRLILGHVAARRTDTAEAETQLTAGLRMARPLGIPILCARLLLALGQLLAATGRRSEGGRHLTAALAVLRDTGGVRWQARALEALGLFRHDADDRAGAEAAWQEALHLLGTVPGDDGADLTDRIVRHLGMTGALPGR